MYEPCSDDASAYFTVPPRACNGHRLETLWEEECTVDRAAANQGIRCEFPFGGRLLATPDGVYWGYGSREFWQADAATTSQEIELDYSLGTTQFIGFDPVANRLYLSILTLDATSGRQVTALFGIDVGTGEARELASFPDMAPQLLYVHGDRLAFISGQMVFSGPLEWGATATIADLTVCSIPSLGMTGAFLDEFTFYTFDEPTSSVVGLDLRGCSQLPAIEVRPAAAATVLFVAQEVLYVQRCEWSPSGCTLQRLTADRSLVDVVREYVAFQRGDTWNAAHPLVVGDDIFIAARLSADVGQPPRLYAWQAESLSPTALAAPLDENVQLAATERYVYVLQVSGRASGDFEDEYQQSIARLIRVAH